MFIFHIALSLAMITAAIGLVLWVWSKNEKNGASLLRVGGAIMLVVSILNIACISYYGIRYGQDGYFGAPNVMTHDSMGKKMMMGRDGKMDMNNSMMQEMMKTDMNQKMPSNNAQPVKSEPNSEEEHQAHHPEGDDKSE